MPILSCKILVFYPKNKKIHQQKFTSKMCEEILNCFLNFQDFMQLQELFQLETLSSQDHCDLQQLKESNHQTEKSLKSKHFTFLIFFTFKMLLMYSTFFLLWCWCWEIWSSLKVTYLFRFEAALLASIGSFKNTRWDPSKFPLASKFLMIELWKIELLLT